MRLSKKIFLLIVSLCAITASFAFAKPNFSMISQETVLPLKRVSLQGDWQYIGADEINTRINQIVSSGFVGVSLEDVKRVVESEPWVKEVSIRRIWPDGIHVRVEERKPLAVWGDQGFVDTDHNLVRTGGGGLPADLPRFNAPASSVAEVADMYRKLRQLTIPIGVQVKNINFDERRSWSVELSDGVKLNIGSDDVDRRIKRILSIYKNIDEYLNKVIEIDLRYSNGFTLRYEDSVEGHERLKRSVLLQG